MRATFNNLPEAQSFAQANNISKYWRIWFDDAETKRKCDQGGWMAVSTPRMRIYMSLEHAIEDVTCRAAGTAERTTIETLWTSDVSDSPKAR